MLNRRQSAQAAEQDRCDAHFAKSQTWDRVRVRSFGRSPAQLITEFDRTRPALNNEQAPTKQPFTRGRAAGLFELADLEVERALAPGRKGAVAAYRDATGLKTPYAWRCVPTKLVEGLFVAALLLDEDVGEADVLEKVGDVVPVQGMMSSPGG